MKKILLTFVIIGVLFSYKSYASQDSTILSNTAKVSQNTNVLKIIKKEFIYPQKAIESTIQGEVYVNFSVNSSGQLTIISTNGMDNELKTYVANELTKIKFPQNIVNNEEEFNIKFSLKILE